MNLNLNTGHNLKSITWMWPLCYLCFHAYEALHIAFHWGVMAPARPPKYAWLDISVVARAISRMRSTNVRRPRAASSSNTRAPWDLTPTCSSCSPDNCARSWICNKRIFWVQQQQGLNHFMMLNLLTHCLWLTVENSIMLDFQPIELLMNLSTVLPKQFLPSPIQWHSAPFQEIGVTPSPAKICHTKG